MLVRGPEELLRERAIARVIGAAREADPTTEVIALPAVGYTAGSLVAATSPSLFAEPKVVVIEAAEAGNAALDADILAYLAQPDPDAVVVIEHGGGVRGKKMLDGVTAAKAPVLTAPEVKRDADKIAFVNDELRVLGRRAAPEAAQALVAAVGADLRELAAATAQLAADTVGTITLAMVEQFYGGRVAASGFAVADAAVARDVGAAVTLLRHALATGGQPVAILGALAMKLRTLIKVAAIRVGTNVGSGNVTARELGLQDWQVRNAQRELSNWDIAALGRALCAVAAADEGVKTGRLDPEYAVERAVLAVARRAGLRSNGL